MNVNAGIFFFVLLFRCHAAPVSNSLVVLVKTPITAQLQQTTTLPCWLNPVQNAESLEVRWYPGDTFDAPILLYKGGKFVETPNSSYTGRTSFGLKDAASGGLVTGDVSLELRGVTPEDGGRYTCYVSSEQGYDSTSVELNVIERGTRPVLTAEWTDEKVNLSCKSAGWFPQPELRWSDNKRTLSPGELRFGEDPFGLVWVHSWVLVSAPSEVTCSVDLSVGKKEDAHVRLGNFVQTNSKGSPVAGWVAFALLLLAVGVGVGVLYFKKRGKTADSSDGPGSAEKEVLLQPRSLAELKEEHYANVKLDTTENPYVIIRGQIVRDRKGSFPDGDQVTCLTAVKGTPGITSGKHYWEVSMGKAGGNIPLKQSWWVGVTTQTSFPLSKEFRPSESNRFWFLASSPNTPDSRQISQRLQLNNVLVQGNYRPETLGVFLDYEGGELSFYDVEKESLIGTFIASFECEVFPFFNPGKYDMTPMKILHREAPARDAEKTESANNTEA